MVNAGHAEDLTGELDPPFTERAVDACDVDRGRSQRDDSVYDGVDVTEEPCVVSRFRCNEWHERLTSMRFSRRDASACRSEDTDNFTLNECREGWGDGWGDGGTGWKACATPGRDAPGGCSRGPLRTAGAAGEWYLSPSSRDAVTRHAPAP